MKLKSVNSFHPCKSVIQTNGGSIKAHDGKIEFESYGGEGTKIMIHLPNH